MTSLTSKFVDKTKQKIRIVVNDNTTTDQSKTKSLTSRHPKNINVYKNGSYNNVKSKNGITYDYGKLKNGKNWENWERIRQQKLERMKNICFESYRQLKNNAFKDFKSKPKQLNSTWYTDNIYSNPSEDLEYDFIPECLKIDPKLHHELDNIRDNDVIFLNTVDEEFSDNRYDRKVIERRGEGEGASGYGLQRSISCKEFYSPSILKTTADSESYDYNENLKADNEVNLHKGTRYPYTESLHHHKKVPKSYSFDTAMDPLSSNYNMIPSAHKSKYFNQDIHQDILDYKYNQKVDKNKHPLLSTGYSKYVCCAREQCTNAKCLLTDLHSEGFECIPPLQCNWSNATNKEPRTWFRDRYTRSNGTNISKFHSERDWPNISEEGETGWRYPSSYSIEKSIKPCSQVCPMPPTVICCCTAGINCCCQYHRRQHYALNSKANHCCTNHNIDRYINNQYHENENADFPTRIFNKNADHFIRKECENFEENQFLDKDKQYLTDATNDLGKNYQHLNYLNSDWDIQSHDSFEKDSCSDSTELDLIDFTIDLEKYWTELEKPPSPIDFDMQQRNMQCNLKAKNINMECYNNGLPVHLHDREQERLFIKKSLLAGMPSPPQRDFSAVDLNAGQTSDDNYIDNTFSPFRRFQHYNHKVYPTPEPLQPYQQNNYYRKELSVQTQQPQQYDNNSFQRSSALNVINNIFSIYKPNKYASENCHYNKDSKPDTCKKMNIASTHRPLGIPYSEYIDSMKRPIIVNAEQPHFKIIPEKTGLKISPILNSEPEYDEKETHLKLASTARPLLLPH